MSGRFKSVLRGHQASARQLFKLVPTEDGKGTQRVPDCVEGFRYEVNIDWDQVTSEMVRKAACNANGRSQFGPIQVKITDRWRI